MQIIVQVWENMHKWIFQLMPCIILLQWFPYGFDESDGLQTLLGFVKGLDTIPSLGFVQSPRFKFHLPNPVDEYDGYANVLAVPVFMRTTTTPCNGVWIRIACGTSAGYLSHCYLQDDAFSAVLNVTVAQLASGASCQFEQMSGHPISSGYGHDISTIWVKGTCFGIFNVCAGNIFDSCCDPLPTTTAATNTYLPTTKSASLSQYQDTRINSDGFDVNTAIIAGSSVGGCLYVAAILIAVYLICRRTSCIKSRIMPNSDTRNNVDDTDRCGCSGGEAADDLP